MINRSMIQSAVTMGQLQTKLDLIGNNLANSQTTGYKSRSADFSSLLYQQIDNQSDNLAETGRLTPDGIRIGSGAGIGHTNIDLSLGSLQETGRTLDAAFLQEGHMFEVLVPTEAGIETQYTRAGNFYLSPLNDGEVMLTDTNGNPVAGEDGERIVLEDGFQSITLNADGSVVVRRNGAEETAGRLAVVDAVRPRMLEAVGGNRFRIPDGIAADGLVTAVQPGETVLKSGTLETSNVDVSKQMTDMLMAQRAYQFNAKSISTGDQMMGLVNQLRS
ncbi:flagellar hook-basal body protein [Bacillus sp. SB49]|uniref:flagellar hook-basal body protein n=1 Tax=Bacillus sp. SB49 TaxID=1071080 RepID=UPI000401F138|nr:flagellar hook-basal body protein [Bacillus sp. SB49]QHT48144.1 flagellar hook-basal body protein [Bacillus sp. SB49]